MAWTMHVVFHIKVVGFGPFMLVFMGTLYEIAIMTCEVPTGVVADMKSRRLSVTIGWFLLGLGFFIEGAFPVAAVVIGAQLLLGFGETFVSGAHDAWVADEIPHSDPGVAAGTAFLKGQQASFLGRLAGTWVGVLFVLISLPAVLMASGVGFMIFAFLARRWMTEKGFHRSEEQHHFWNQFKEGWTIVRSSRTLLLILLAGVFYGLASEGFDRLWNKTFLDAFHLPPVGLFGQEFWWPVLATGGTLGGMALNALIRRFVDITSPFAISLTLLVMTSFLIFGIAGFALSTSIFVATFLFIASRSIRRALDPLLKTWVNLHAKPESRATVLSFASQSHSLGEICGGPIVGTIGQFYAAKTAVVTAALLLFPTLPTLLAARKSAKGSDVGS